MKHSVAGEIQAAGLDVLEKEPLELSNPLNRVKKTEDKLHHHTAPSMGQRGGTYPLRTGRLREH